MKLLALFLFSILVLMPSPLRAAMSASKEALECFQWFAALGPPDVSDATFAEVWSGALRPDFECPQLMDTFRAFVRVLPGNKMEIVRTDLVTGELPLGLEPNSPRTAGFVATPLLEHIKGLIEVLPDDSNGGRPRFGATLGTKAEYFFLAFVCWQRGETEWSERLFAAAKKLRGQDFQGRPAQLTMREELEHEFGHQAMWAAVLRLRGAGFAPARMAYYSMRKEEPSRTELLETFRRIADLYPNCHHAARARATAEVLEKMVAEDALHVAMTDEQIAALPVEKQVSERLYQLRDLSVDQWAEPGGVDIFAHSSWIKDNPANAAQRLLDIGMPAAPQLIEAITDPRLTRSVECHRSFYFSHRALTVGECALRILTRISGRGFYPPSGVGLFDEPESMKAIQEVARAWWKEIQTKGEKDTLIKAIQSGTQDPADMVKKLHASDPAAVEGALLVGTENARWALMRGIYIKAMTDLKAPAVREFLLREARQGDLDHVRPAAVRALFDRNDSESEKLIIDLWREIRKSGNHALPDSFKTTLELLCAAGTAATIKAVADVWDQCSPMAKYEIISALRQFFGTGTDQEHQSPWQPKAKPPEAAATLAAKTLLVRALEDQETVGISGGVSGVFSFDQPRVCDLALHALHALAPSEFQFSPKAGRHQRNVDRITAINGWRSLHHQPPLPLPERHLPVLKAEDALRIAEVAVEGTEVEILQLIRASTGSDLTPETFTQPLRKLTEMKVKPIISLEIEAVREADLRGVQLRVRCQGVPEPRQGRTGTFNLQWSASADDRSIGGGARSGMLATASDEQFWASMEEHIAKALNQPPGVFLVVRARLEFDLDW